MQHLSPITLLLPLAIMQILYYYPTVTAKCWLATILCGGGLGAIWTVYGRWMAAVERIEAEAVRLRRIMLQLEREKYMDKKELEEEIEII